MNFFQLNEMMNEDSCWVCKNKLSHGKFVANIFNLHEDGLKPLEIAQKLGISKQHVYEILNQNGHRQKSLKRSKAMKEMHASKKKSKLVASCCGKPLGDDIKTCCAGCPGGMMLIPKINYIKIKIQRIAK